MSWFSKKQTAPSLCPSNPGMAPEAKVAFSNGERNWSESFHVVQLAAYALSQLKYSITYHDPAVFKPLESWLEHAASGYLLSPQLVELQPLEDGGVRTVTTMQINHPRLVPNGLFEYQHSTGDTVADSLAKGFTQWAQTDFVPLLEALQEQPATCTMLRMEFPANDGKPARVRRALLGPVARLMTNPPAPSSEVEEHPFCACCLLTRSFEAFKGHFEDDGFFGLRLFAARDADGTPQADCRINGDDWEPGAEALRAYARTWPEAGYEFRKQYVVLQNAE